MSKDQFAVTRLMAIELQPGLVCGQRLGGSALRSMQRGRRETILAIEVQEIERVIDKPRTSRSPSVADWVWAKLGNPASSSPQSSPSIYAVFAFRVGERRN